MRRSAMVRRILPGLLTAAIVCTLGCRQEGGLAAGGGKEYAPLNTYEPVTYDHNRSDSPPGPVEEDVTEDGPVEEEPAGKYSVEKNATEKNPLAGCQQCHVDIEDEYAVSLHFEQKVSCKDCHGPSDGHLADENNEVKPDEVFARKDVDRLCGKCHECSRPTSAESPEHRPKVCIDCHGPHDSAPVKETP